MDEVLTKPKAIDLNQDMDKQPLETKEELTLMPQYDDSSKEREILADHGKENYFLGRKIKKNEK